MHPHILYWKWNEEDLDVNVALEKARDIAKRSIFNLVYVSLHSAPPEKCMYANPHLANNVKAVADEFKKHGIKMTIDIDILREKYEAQPEDRSWFVLYNDVKFDQDGSATLYLGELYDRVVRCWSVVMDEDGKFSDKVDVTDKAQFDGVNELCVNAGKEHAGRTLIYFVARYDVIDINSDASRKLTRELFELVKDSGVAGACVDECGYRMKNNCRRSAKFRTILDDLDLDKVNFFVDHVTYSPTIDNSYKKHFGEALADNLIYLWFTEKGNEAKSYEVINNYIENMRHLMVECESVFYNLTKEYFGKDAFCGVHSTWWGGPYDYNLEPIRNGLDWWQIKRDYAQTDEACPIAVRNSLARSCPEDRWYNMWYSGRTMLLKSYFTETWTNARFGGRTHHLGYECKEPGVVFTLIQPGRLEAISECEEKIAELNKLQKSVPDSRVLVIFGYEATTNWKMSDPEERVLNRAGKTQYNVFKLTNDLFDFPYLCEMVPSYEIEYGNVKLENGKISYHGHEYDAAVMLYPDGAKDEVLSLLKDYDKVGNLLVMGDVKIGHDGKKSSFDAKKEFKNCIDVTENAEDIAKWLLSKGIKQNAGKNYSIFEDGSITVTTLGDKSCTNGVYCEELGINEPDADIVYISPDGSKTVI